MHAEAFNGRTLNRIASAALVALIALASFSLPTKAGEQSMLIERHEGFVDSGGVLIYYETIGRGPPLMVLHGGPGASHDDFLPYLLPLGRQRQLVFIDERGSGHSQRLTDPAGYTLEAMVKDVETVRIALGFQSMDLMGHSFGGILAQAYAIAHPAALNKLILVGTGSTATRIDADFAKIKESLDKNLRDQINELEKRGIFLPNGAQSPEYRKLADQAELPYMYFNGAPAWDSPNQALGWDVLREMWGRRSDFKIDGNLRGFDFIPALRKLAIPSLIIYGDHDLVSATTAKETHDALANSTLIEVAKSGHMTFVDMTQEFIDSVSSFLNRPQK